MTMVDALPSVFSFELNGETYELPAFNRLKSGLVRKIRKLEEADALYVVLEAVCDERTLAALDDLEMSELREIMQGWQTAAGVRLGESSGSSS